MEKGWAGALPWILLFADKHTLKDLQRIDGFPPGNFVIEVEIFEAGSECYIACLRIVSNIEGASFVDRDLKIDVDTGFLVVLWAEPSKELALAAEEAENRILNGNEKAIEFEFLMRENSPVGFIISTGTGDGQYRLYARNTGQQIEFECRFLEDLREIG